VFTELQPAGKWIRNYRLIAASVIAHMGLLAVILLHRPAITQLVASELAYGNGEHSSRVVYIAPGDEPLSLPDPSLLLPTKITPRRQRVPTPKKREQPQPVAANAEVAAQPSRAGSPLGTLIEGPISGHEVHVAYPIVFPDPALSRSQLPAGLQGDVIVEVTIDAQGNVVETRVMQAIGHGIDEKIVSALRQWHFQPATLDGTPVASKHDVHFHFPS
jgi:TonB family protein